MNTYNIGPLTMEYVFRRAGLENMADMQAVMDAVEAGLQSFYDCLDGCRHFDDGYIQNSVIGNALRKWRNEADAILDAMERDE